MDNSHDNSTNILPSIPDNVKEQLYTDALHPGAVQIGKAVETVGMVVNRIMSPLRAWAAAGEENTNKLSDKIAQKLNNVPTDKIVSPNKRIAVPAIIANSYTDEEELRDLYANLLAKSMNKETVSSVHPAFVEIIKQLSPREALFLKTIPILEQFMPFCRIRKQKKSKYMNIYHFSLHKDNIIRLQEAGTDIITYYFALDSTLFTPEEIQPMIENFLRLKLIDYSHDTILTNPNSYQKFYNDKFTQSISSDIKLDSSTEEIAHIPSFTSPTNFGLIFNEVCVK